MTETWDVFMLVAIVWFVASLYLLRFAAFGVANFRRQKDFEIPLPERYRIFEFHHSPHRLDQSLELLTHEVRKAGFEPLYDLEDSVLPHNYSRLCLDEEGTLCYLLPAPRPRHLGDHPENASYLLVTRFRSGVMHCTTNVPYYSRWMDSLPGRQSFLVDNHLPFFEGLGQHEVQKQRALERGPDQLLPYLEETLIADITEESRRDYEAFVDLGYFHLDEAKRCYRPSRRFLFAYTSGIASPGMLGKVLLGSAAVVTVVAPLALLALS